MALSLPDLVTAPPMNEPTHAVFLSYASQDADAARRIGETLREAGVEVWLDTSELRGGDAWDAAIRKQIRACTLFMPVISANTRARPEGYFRLEWKLAVDRSHLMADEKCSGLTSRQTRCRPISSTGWRACLPRAIRLRPPSACRDRARCRRRHRGAAPTRSISWPSCHSRIRRATPPSTI